jgi:hypothetical protein
MSAIAYGFNAQGRKGGKALRNRQKNETPAEFRLLVECCRWAFDPSQPDSVRTAATTVDWPSFVALADRHRVAGLAWDALHSIGIDLPGEARSQLSGTASAITGHGLRAAVESARLSAAFNDASVDHLFVKGLAVGALAYRSPFLKQSWDIDVLVAAGGIAGAAKILHGLGYEPISPPFGTDWKRIQRWHRVQKDSAWRHRASGLVVELHSRLSDNLLLIPGVGLESPRRQVAVTDAISLPTLAHDEMFAHLCVHGASSAWFRLKWISDLAAVVTRSGGDIPRLYRRSQELGAGRSAGQALLLAYRLFRSLEEPLLRSIESDSANDRLARLALNQLLAPEPLSRPLGTVAIHASQFLLRPDLRFKASEARRQLAVSLSNLLD